MKTRYLFYFMLLVPYLTATDSLAQRFSRWTNYDAVTTYGIGLQGINLNEFNQALQQAGYNTILGQVPMLSIASQFSRPNRPMAFHTEIGISVGSGSTVTNGTYKAKCGFFYAKFGTSYQIIRTDRFQLGPQVGLVSLPFHVRISQISNTTPPLNSVLTNPGSTQTASINTSSLGLDAGVTGSLRIPYRQQQLDCSTIERSFVIGLNAGYRFATRAPLNTGQEISASNPAIQLSGWYAGIRLGFGMRVRSTTAPVTY